ncbi:MAG: hypothetical protein DYG89_37280 [Caldilinea sp. CFX5]|nr:hypothetical protein [Caldilinea sp. CFX5]
MTNSGMKTLPLPEQLQTIEREKARLLLEAHTLKAQASFTEAAERFAQAARYEEQLADWAANQALTDLYYLHAFSALSCWAQAGDPHRALQMSNSLLRAPSLTARQRSQLKQYQATLEQRWVSWMEQWSQPVFVSA